MAIKFDTRQYVRVHGKEPRGRGFWYFAIDSKAGVRYMTANGSRAAAQNAVRAAIKKIGIRRGDDVVVEVMP
jgi:hypothetical protein